MKKKVMTLQESLEKLHNCVADIKKELTKAFPILEKMWGKK